MTYRYVLDRSDKKRNPCPSCGHVGVFRPYVHVETNEPAGPEYGVCDRIHNCCYINYPRHDMDPQETASFKPPPPPPSTSWRCPPEIVAMTSDHRGNAFAHWLVGIYGDRAKEVLRMYKVGTYPPSEKNPHLAGSMVYWQIDANGEYRSGKIIPYGPDGKRVKSLGSLWVHSVVWDKSMSDLGIGQVLFGSHLLGQEGPVAVVESEKSALICAIEYPGHIWLATGGSNMIGLDLFMPLAGRDVTLFPDAGMYVDRELVNPNTGKAYIRAGWATKAADIEPLMQSLVVSDVLECIGAEEGEDVADYLCVPFQGQYVNYLRQMDIDIFAKPSQEQVVMAEAKPEVAAALAMYNTSGVHPAIARMIDKNPAVETLVDVLGLETEKVRISSAG